MNKGDVTSVLKWVNKDGEQEVREAFDLAMKVRPLDEDARKLGDAHFFETLVRVHRAAEGVPFTGLKPSGHIDPGLIAADKALEEESVTAPAAHIAMSVQRRILIFSFYKKMDPSLRYTSFRMTPVF